MKPWALTLAVLLASATSVSSSFGESVTLTTSGVVTGVDGLNITAKVGYSTYTGDSAGLIKWTLANPGDVGGTTVSSRAVNNSIYTFCIQMGQDFSTSRWDNPYTFDVVSINHSNPIGGTDHGYIDPTAAGQMQLLTDRFLPYVSLSQSQTINGKTYSAGEVAAAFQLSLWEIEYDGGSGQNPTGSSPADTFPRTDNNYFNNSGKFTATANAGTDAADAIGLATYFLNNFTSGTSGIDPTYSSFALTNSNSQDQFLGVVNANAVPLPAALPLGASLLLGLGIAKKVRSRRHS
jgi:hypothetical protein